jgi:gliding motility-associated-like protein
MRYLLLVVCLFTRLHVHAQKETSQWFLHNNRIEISSTGIRNINPSGISSAFNPRIASTSISDANGNLLFACDGKVIIDRNLSVMPALKNAAISSDVNKILAYKIPGTSKYYVFYAKQNGIARNSTCTVKYAVVDLLLNGGLGDVVSYDEVVASDLSMGFTIAQGPDTEEGWLVTHRNATDSFLTYKITGAGLNKSPVISKAGLQAVTSSYIFKDLKTSPNGKIIAGISYRDYTDLFASAYSFVEAFYFDPITGMLTNKVRSRRTNEYYIYSLTVEFSPDNRLLYVGKMERVYGLQPCGWGGGRVMQYNLCYTDSADFTNYSKQVVYHNNFCYPDVSWARIQTAVDKRIYMPYTGIELSRISNPNRIGTSCNFVQDAHRVDNLNNGNVVAPTFPHRQLEKAIKNNIVYEGGCFPNPITFSITNDKIAAVSWDFGDRNSASNTSSDMRPQHVFSAPGLYTVTARLIDELGRSETVTELIEIKDPQPRLLEGFPEDTTICSDQRVKIKLQSPVNGLIHWWRKNGHNGERYSMGATDSVDLTYSGVYLVEMRQNDCNGCVLVDSITITSLERAYVDLGSDRAICSGDSLKLSGIHPTANHTWSTGEATRSIWVKSGGMYWVEAEIDKNGCPKRDTIVLTQAPDVKFSLPNDTTLCNSQTILLNPNIPDASYLWQNGSTQKSFTVSQPGKYWVSVQSRNNCRWADTIHVSYLNAQQVRLGNDTTLCVGDSLILNATVPGAIYKWSTNATTSEIKIKTTGTYWVEVDNGSCVVTDTIHVRFNVPPRLSLGNDTVVCDRSPFILHTKITGANYVWQNGSKEDSFSVLQPGAYWVQVQKDGCTVKDTITIAHKPSPVIYLGKDTVLCNNATLLLNAFNAFATSYQWSEPTAKQATYLVSQPGNYWVTVQANNGCTATDTIAVKTKPLPNFNLGKDTVLCQGEVLSIQVQLPNAQYLWSDFNRQSINHFIQSGLYWLEVTQDGCSKRDSILVSFKPSPIINLGIDTLLCEGASLKLNAYFPTTTYLWNTGSTSSEITVNQPGNYAVAATLNGCIKKDTISIQYTYLPRFTLGKDTMLCNGQSFVLNPRLTGVSYTWQDGSTGPVFTVKQPGLYSLMAANNCGSATDEIEVAKGICHLYMPTAFTPNNDGNNDVFRVKYPQFIKSFKMQLFNRWGTVVYTSANPNMGWDGTYKGARQPEGNYIWVITLTDLDGNQSSYRGNVILII